jgi:predicted DNA-binding protein YlxM (UPF0122 family)
VEEKKIDTKVSLCLNDNVEEIQEAVVVTTPRKKGVGRDKVDTEKLKIARSLYISTDMSLKEIADKVGIKEQTLSKYSSKEAWSMLKVNPEFEVFSRELVDSIYVSLDFFDDAKDILHSTLKKKEFQTPKDIKMIVEAFKVADERTNALRLLKENANRDGY